MEIKKGVAVSPGVVVREAFILDREDIRIDSRTIDPSEVEKEVARFEEARKALADEIRLQADEMGKDISQILRFHSYMLDDKKVREDTAALIRQNHLSEWAVSRVFRRIAKQFRNLKDPYLRERYVDIHDVEKRLLRKLRGGLREDIRHLTKDVVVVARDMAPSELAGMDRTKIAGLAIDTGGKTSHTAIVARTMGIPAVVGLGTISSEVSGGDFIVVDGTEGRVIVNPDSATIEKYRKKEAEFRKEREDLGASTRHLPAETLDGHPVLLLCNIEHPADIDVGLENGTDGVGLYRTEFLYGDGGLAPTEEEHVRAYQDAVRRLRGRPLVIRTLDFGADKFLDEDEPPEKNPFLGCRSIRLCFENLDVFKTQLRAILRVSHQANVQIMFPMISSKTELVRAKAILEEVKEDLAGEDVPFNREIEVGIMIEVPSAALIADTLARDVAFFSIGTNDLIQYTLAVDRVNERVANLYQPAHPAILRLIRRVIEAGERNRVKVSMCGEMSGDENFTVLLLGLGLREFSLNPAVVPRVKRIIRATTMIGARRIAAEVLDIEDPEEALAFLAEKTKSVLADLGTSRAS